MHVRTKQDKLCQTLILHEEDREQERERDLKMLYAMLTEFEGVMGIIPLCFPLWPEAWCRFNRLIAQSPILFLLTDRQGRDLSQN